MGQDSKRVQSALLIGRAKRFWAKWLPFRWAPVRPSDNRREFLPTWRDAFAAVLVALVTGTAVALPVFGVLGGLSIDILTATRWHAFGPRHDPSTSPVAVVALDEESLRTPP